MNYFIPPYKWLCVKCTIKAKLTRQNIFWHDYSKYCFYKKKDIKIKPSKRCYLCKKRWPDIFVIINEAIWIFGITNPLAVATTFDNKVLITEIRKRIFKRPYKEMEV